MRVKRGGGDTFSQAGQPENKTFGDGTNIYWAVLSNEQMSNGYPFSLLNDEQMSNKVGVEHQPVYSRKNVKLKLLFHGLLHG